MKRRLAVIVCIVSVLFCAGCTGDQKTEAVGLGGWTNRQTPLFPSHPYLRQTGTI